MKCINCGIPVMKTTLYRTAPLGIKPADNMCISCIKELHPELAKNILEDKTDLECDLEKICYKGG